MPPKVSATVRSSSNVVPPVDTVTVDTPPASAIDAGDADSAHDTVAPPGLPPPPGGATVVTASSSTMVIVCASPSAAPSRATAMTMVSASSSTVSSTAVTVVPTSGIPGRSVSISEPTV